MILALCSICCNKVVLFPAAWYVQKNGIKVSNWGVIPTYTTSRPGGGSFWRIGTRRYHRGSSSSFGAGWDPAGVFFFTRILRWYDWSCMHQETLATSKQHQKLCDRHGRRRPEWGVARVPQLSSAAVFGHCLRHPRPFLFVEKEADTPP